MMEKTIKELLKAIKSSDTKKTNPYDTSATVTRVENGVAYVHIPGGVDETPVKLTVNVQPGDEVQIRVGGGQAWITGNETAPPTDDKVANVAAETAIDAAKTAAEAGNAAASAAQAADTAWHHADDAAQAAESAQNSLKSVVAGAVTVEKAVSVMQTALEAVVDYDPSTDTTKEYFWHDANGAHVLGTSGDYRNDIDSTGMKIVDTSTETTVAEFGETVRVGKESEAHLSMTNSSLKGEDSDGERTFEITSVGASTPIERLYDAGFRITIPAQERDATGDLQISSVIGESLEAVGVATIYIKYGIADIIDEDDLKLAQVQYGTPVSYQLSTYSTPFQEVSLSYDGDDTITFYIKVSAPYSYDLALQSDYIGLVRGTSASNFVFGNGVASGLFSFSAGEGTDAQAGQSVFGKFNKRDDAAALIVGNGATSATRSNAFMVDWDGNVAAAGALTASNIGTVHKTSGTAATTIAAWTWTTLCTLTLQPGTYLVHGYLHDGPANVTSLLRLITYENDVQTQRQVALTGNTAFGANISVSGICAITAQQTVQLLVDNATAISNTQTPYQGEIVAVRIK